MVTQNETGKHNLIESEKYLIYLRVRVDRPSMNSLEPDINHFGSIKKKTHFGALQSLFFAFFFKSM